MVTSRKTIIIFPDRNRTLKKRLYPNFAVIYYNMTTEEICAALNHSWLCLKDGYYCPVCNRSFPLGIWAKAEEDKIPTLSELSAQASC